MKSNGNLRYNIEIISHDSSLEKREVAFMSIKKLFSPIDDHPWQL